MIAACPRCGHTVRDSAAFCGFCGQELAAPQPKPPSIAQAPNAQKSPQGEDTPHPRWTLTLVVLLAALLLLVGVVILGVVQVRYGRQERSRAEQNMSEVYYQQGLVYLQQKEFTLAAIEFELATELNPQHEQANAKLAEVRQTLGIVQPAPTTPIPAETSPTIQPEPDPLAPLRAAYAGGDWETVLTLAERLPVEAAQDGEVRQMRFEAYYQGGLRLVEESEMAEAIARFDQALALQPDHALAAQAKQWATLYLAATQSWNSDWPQVIEGLATLYSQSPDYGDVRVRLHDAYLAYADQLVGQSDFCAASDQFGLALVIVEDAEVTSKQDDAQTRCAQATAAATPEGPTVPAGTFVGRVVDQTAVDARIIYIHGKVLDKQGQGVGGARVQIQAWDWKAAATTDGAGQYSFDGLRDPVTFTVTLLDLPSVPVDAPTAWHKITWVNFEQAR